VENGYNEIYFVVRKILLGISKFCQNILLSLGGTYIFSFYENIVPLSVFFDLITNSVV
jgi:hypothetical protein